MKRKQGTEYPPADRWRDHFSVNAADLLQVSCGHDPELLKDAIRKCMARSPRSTRINERTVVAVLIDLT